jgi:hypothetical protein
MVSGERLTMRELVLASRFERGRFASVNVESWRALLLKSLTNLISEIGHKEADHVPASSGSVQV